MTRTILDGGRSYRAWMRLMHRFDLHRTRRIGPMEDGATIHRCDWCGASRKEWPLHITEQRMRDAGRTGRVPLSSAEVPSTKETT